MDETERNRQERKSQDQVGERQERGPEGQENECKSEVARG